MEEMLERVTNESANVNLFLPFYSCDRLTRIKVVLLFCNNRAIYWTCAGKKYASSMYDSFLYNIYMYICTHLYCYFVTIEQSIGHVQVKNMRLACMIHFYIIYICIYVHTHIYMYTHIYVYIFQSKSAFTPNYTNSV